MARRQKTAEVRLRERAWILLVFGVLVAWIVGLGGLGSESTAMSVLGYVGIVAGVGMIAWAVYIFTNRRA